MSVWLERLQIRGHHVPYFQHLFWLKRLEVGLHHAPYFQHLFWYVLVFVMLVLWIGIAFLASDIVGVSTFITRVREFLKLQVRKGREVAASHERKTPNSRRVREVWAPLPIQNRIEAQKSPEPIKKVIAWEAISLSPVEDSQKRTQGHVLQVEPIELENSTAKDVSGEAFSWLDEHGVVPVKLAPPL
jgi:hypothetical protein